MESPRAITSLTNPLAVAKDSNCAGLFDRNMVLRKASLIAVGGFDSDFIDDGGDADLSVRMIAARMALGWCPAGFVWRRPTIGVGEFLGGRICDGRADAMLAIKHPGHFVAAPCRAHLMAAVCAGRRRRVDGTPEGIVVRILAAIFSLSGMVARVLARRVHIIAAQHSATVAYDSNDVHDSTCHFPIAHNHRHTAYPAGHR